MLRRIDRGKENTPGATCLNNQNLNFSINQLHEFFEHVEHIYIVTNT